MAGESVPIPQLRNLKERAFEEFKRFVAIFLYLWVVLGCFRSIKASSCRSNIWTTRSTPLRLSMR